jgi:hypothetical protein
VRADPCLPKHSGTEVAGQNDEDVLTVFPKPMADGPWSMTIPELDLHLAINTLPIIYQRP